MHKFYSDDNFTLYQDTMLNLLENIEPNSIDSIVTDPPYEINFMVRNWDSQGISYDLNTWKRCLEVLKPGGYMLVFGSSRTFHRIACAIEDAGFEIRDTIMWLYGSGMPKSMNIGLAIDKKNGVESKVIGTKGTMPDFIDAGRKNSVNKIGVNDGLTADRKVYLKKEANNKYNGWGTTLKPSYEPIIVARKPCEGTCIENVMNYGTGGMNIKECTIGNQSQEGRYPANTIFTYDNSDFNEVCRNLGDKARYFYCAKASKRDREEGLENFVAKKVNDGRTALVDNGYQRGETLRKNVHPTVKPTTLMQYLIRLVTPKNGTILDPFNGSGSTGKAAMYENQDRNVNYKYIGIDISEEYLNISKARILYAINHKSILDADVNKTTCNKRVHRLF